MEGSLRIRRSEAVCLTTQEFRETSRLLVAYTKDYGKLRLLVRGVRGARALSSGYLEPFSRHHLVFYTRRTPSLFLLSQWELAEGYPGIRQDLEKIAHAYYACELIDALTPWEDPQPEIFELVCFHLEWLNHAQTVKRATRVLETRLLTALGLLASFRVCVICHRVLDTSPIRFSLASHGPLCSSCAPQDPGSRPVLAGTIAWLAHVQAGELDALERIRVAKEIGQELECLMGSLVNQLTQGQLKSLPMLKRLTPPLPVPHR